MQKPYSEYVSLGINCEGAFQIRRILGHDASSFFSWNVTPLPALEALIQSRFEGILQWENISSSGGGLLHDSSHNYKFHSPFSCEDFSNDSEAKRKFSEHKEKAGYLVSKFLRSRELDESTVYFYKAEDQGEDLEFRKIICRVRDLLGKIHESSQFSLVVLQDESRRDSAWQEEFIFNRYLKRTAPWSDATDGHVQSWDKVFREFPFDGPMYFSGY